MKLKVRINKNKFDDYILNSNHVPRYKEFIEIGNHRYIVDYVVYEADEIKQDVITDVIIYITEIY